VLDVVVRWEGQLYPPLTGLVVRVARRRAFAPGEQVDVVDHDGVRLSSARLDLADFERRDAELTLMADVVDLR
jgi:hypothetical protein